MQKLWNQHGEKNFKFEILEITENYKEREKHWIKKLNPTLNSKYQRVTENSPEFLELLRVMRECLGGKGTESVDEQKDRVFIAAAAFIRTLPG
jgi:hypothetical protein